MEHGDYMTFKLDWGADWLEVCEIGPVLQQFCEPGEVGKNGRITPFVHAMDCLAKLHPEAGPPFHFLIDVQFDRENMVANVHCTKDFRSVVDVPRERLEAVLCKLLTPREREVAALLFEGGTIRCIAASLHIAEGTVKRIIYNIYQKMGVGGQVDLVREIYARLAQSNVETCYSCGCQSPKPMETL